MAWRLDAEFESHAEFLSTLQWCVEAVENYNGTRMLKVEPSLVLVGDAPEVGFGVFAPGGKRHALGFKEHILTSWSQPQLQLLAGNQIWCLCKELDCELSMVWQPREHEPQQLAGDLSQAAGIDAFA
ncbi:hypothetical protein N2152v2_002739 [Parachlorella kessleri]